MINIKAARVFLSAMALSAVGFGAIPPAVSIRIGGADLVAENHYAVAEAAIVTIAVSAKPGDTIWLLASSLDGSGEPADTTVVMLMLGTTQDGLLSGDFLVPAGLAGQSFQLEAHAMSPLGFVASSTTVRVDIQKNPGLKKAKNDVHTEPAD